MLVSFRRRTLCQGVWSHKSGQVVGVDVDGVSVYGVYRTHATEEHEFWQHVSERVFSLGPRRWVFAGDWNTIPNDR